MLAWRALVRGHVLTALLALTGLVHLLLPMVVRSDGTAEGAREMFLRVVPGSVYAILCVALLACACGLVASARESHRLALTVVRPVPAFMVVLGQMLALVAVAFIVLALNACLTCARGGWTDCRHVYAPVLEPPEVEARKSLEIILSDTNAPPEIRSAPRHRLMSILVGREMDRYETIRPGEAKSWTFPSEVAGAPAGVAARIHFSTQYNMSAALSGTLAFGPWSTSVSNNTQSILEMPLVRSSSAVPDGDLTQLKFTNTGRSTVMLRPRQDIEMLSPADSFGMNMFRASAEMLCVVTFLCAFGLFLSTALSRPVALFTALVALIVVEMAPAVVAQYPETLDLPFTDRIGLALSRGVTFATSAVSKPQPLTDLATGTCVEWSALGNAALVDALAAPVILVALTAFLLRRRATASQG